MKFPVKVLTKLKADIGTYRYEPTIKAIREAYPDIITIDKSAYSGLTVPFIQIAIGDLNDKSYTTLALPLTRLKSAYDMQGEACQLLIDVRKLLHKHTNVALLGKVIRSHVRFVKPKQEK